ncbi:HIT domain-containing protein [Paenibacillus aceris]|uniref:Histidine triad (HIT) family protein n=1 Tax=Paenibacillus aceris TaxID=869555 RepID=A0ABS4I0I2_9BACL|nr:HIT domain-containing protein [Paenibacillus aceris]MBP1964220.1 histidine triad (HIT) family protein [Paenibacillus aceris]NHW36546.1 HIT domain-containing protein [Paenibacillus aceris]
MSEDFYCEEVLSGRMSVHKVLESENVLAYHHTRPFYPVHIVTIPKKHISSLITLEDEDNGLLIELMEIVKKVASQVVSEHGACRVITNVGTYQDSKHLHFHVVFGQPLKKNE